MEGAHLSSKWTYQPYGSTYSCRSGITSDRFDPNPVKSLDPAIILSTKDSILRSPSLRGFLWVLYLKQHHSKFGETTEDHALPINKPRPSIFQKAKVSVIFVSSPSDSDTHWSLRTTDINVCFFLLSLYSISEHSVCFSPSSYHSIYFHVVVCLPY